MQKMKKARNATDALYFCKPLLASLAWLARLPLARLAANASFAVSITTHHIGKVLHRLGVRLSHVALWMIISGRTLLEFRELSDDSVRYQVPNCSKQIAVTRSNPAHSQLFHNKGSLARSAWRCWEKWNIEFWMSRSTYSVYCSLCVNIKRRRSIRAV